MSGVLVVDPVFAPRLWGGSTLQEWYGAAVPDEVIGEAWVVSGLPGHSGTARTATGDLMTLADAWRQGLVTGAPRDDDFPLLCKILDPADWLSVQVHPDDAQAREFEGQPRGKAECWYVLAAEPGAELIMGHRRADGAQLRKDLESGDLFDQLIRHPVHAGSFFMVPAGCVHAVGPGMLVYEVQQSSDITYRLYDFDRVGADGRPRDLHIDSGFAVTRPFDPAASLTAEDPYAVVGGTCRDLVVGEYFSVRHWELTGRADLSAPDYRIMTVTSGSGLVEAAGQTVPVARGTSLVIPRGTSVVTDGSFTTITSDPGPALPG